MDAHDAGSDARHGPEEEPQQAPPAVASTLAPRQDSPPTVVPPQESEPTVVPPQESEPTVVPPQESEPPGVPPPRGAAPALAVPPEAEPRTGVAALSLKYQIAAALALAVVAITVSVHTGMVFLHVAPPNTITKQHGKAIDDWIYPEFEQNWKLFAPNPLQQNIAVEVRAQVATADGGTRTTRWYDLSAQDGRAIDGNLLPSHTQQNELRRAWDFFVATHDARNKPVGLRGALSESYLRNIVEMRLTRENAAGEGGSLERLQVRSRTTNVPPPEWSDEQISDKPTYRLLPWWWLPEGRSEGSAR